MVPQAIKTEADINEAMRSLLLDDFSVYGDDASLFAKTQKRISDNTYSFTAPMQCISVFSVLPEENQPQDGRLAVYLFGAGGISSTLLDINQCMGNRVSLMASKNKPDDAHSTENKRGALQSALSRLMVRTIPEASFYPKSGEESAENQAVLQELKRTRLMFRVYDKTYIVSQLALATLGQRIEVKGKALQEPSLERDIFISKRMRVSKNAQFVIKAANGIGKIFMAASENYKLLPMTAIERIYHIFGAENGIGRMKCEGWEIDHSVSRIRFSFLDYEKTQDMACLYGLSEEEAPVPGIEIISSDIGDYAFTVRGFWRVKRGYLYTEEVSRKHSGNINEEEIVDEVKHTIFERYTLLPDRFMELLETDITSASVQEAATALKQAQQAVINTGAAGDEKAPETIALAKAEKYADRQFKDHTKLLTELVRRVMKEVTTSSLQYKKDWIERVTSDLNPAVPYTAYDIMSLILNTQIITKSDDTAEKMRKSMTRLPYLDYGKYRDTVIDKFALFGTRKGISGDNAA